LVVLGPGSVATSIGVHQPFTKCCGYGHPSSWVSVREQHWPWGVEEPEVFGCDDGLFNGSPLVIDARVGASSVVRDRHRSIAMQCDESLPGTVVYRFLARIGEYLEDEVRLRWGQRPPDPGGSARGVRGPGPEPSRGSCFSSCWSGYLSPIALSLSRSGLVPVGVGQVVRAARGGVDVDDVAVVNSGWRLATVADLANRHAWIRTPVHQNVAGERPQPLTATALHPARQDRSTLASPLSSP
jgi:hypothetical protein